MSKCNVCGPKPIKLKEKFKVQQFYKEDSCSKINIYPKTILHAVEDICTGKSLYNILSTFNHIYVLYDISVERTLRNIPPPERRKGLVVTFTHPKEGNKTLRFEGDPSSDCQWSDLSKWTELFVGNKWFKPTNLRINGENIKLDIVDEKGNIAETLCAIIPVSNISAFRTDIVTTLPKKGNPDTIYLLREADSFTKYIWVPQLGKYEQLGTTIVNKGVCGTTTKVLEDKHVTGLSVEGNTLKIVRSDNVEFEAELPTVTTTSPSNSNDNTATQNKIQELERKIQVLESKPDKDTVFDPSDLIRRLTALEEENAKLRNKVASLENAEANRVDLRVVSGRWVSDNHIELSLNNASTINIVKTVTPPPYYTLNVEPTDKSINQGESVTFIPEIVSSNPSDPRSNTQNWDITINGTSDRTFSPNETTVYTVRAIQDETGLTLTKDITITVIPKPVEEPKHKVYYGYHRTETLEDYATTADLNEYIEVESMPATVEWGETEENVFGYYFVAVPKELAPTISRVEMLANGTYNELLPGGYNILEETIDNKPYWFIQDKDINQIDPIGIKIHS